MNSTVIFDLDGTIYFGEEIACEALQAIEILIKNDFDILFLTNNSTKTRSEIAQKLNKFGIATDETKIYSSSFATAKYLSDQNMKDVFVIGSEGFESEIKAFNINCTNEVDCEAVVVGLDIEFNYQKISKALIALNNKAKFIVCNIDSSFPIENNILKPACNAMVGGITGASGKSVDFMVGKPNSYLLEIISKDWNLSKENIWVVGDSMESDIAMANKFGCKSSLVGLQGVTIDIVNKIINEVRHESTRI